MNTRIKFFGLFTILLSLFISQSFSKYDLTEKYSEEFRINPEGTVDIYNKYGQVTIKNWDKQSAKIDVTVTVDGRNEKKAREIMDRISINFSNNDNYVSVKTEIEAEINKNGWTISYSNNFKIEYVVYMPMNTHLKVFNKYGNTTVEAMGRTVDAQIKYGNIDMDDVKGDVKLILGYGNANMKNMRNLNSEIKYANLYAEKVGNLSMLSKYSKLDIDEIQNATIESKYDTYKIKKVEKIKNSGKYDNFRIREIGQMHIDTKYTQIDLEYLHDELQVEQKYGDVKIGELAATASLLDFDLRYTNVAVRRINNGYTLDMEGDHTDCNIHDDFHASYKNDDDECCDLELRGTYGNGATKIVARMDYGGLRIN